MSAAPIHLLHVPKTGGSAVKAVLEPVAQARGIVFHKHNVTLAQVPLGERVIFFVRHPVSRFISGFNSRLRRGVPHHEGRHTRNEQIAFAAFQTPNSLAEALCSENDETRAAAQFAMKAISHTRRRLTDMLGSPADVERRRADLLFIGFQESLPQDFERLKQLLALPCEFRLPDDEIVAHRTPHGFETTLSRQGKRAIRQWYREDLALYRHLKELAPQLAQTR